ncbi:MAG: molybdate ABC transporter substrate-binding protein [Spirosomataceae bacterium]
MKKIVLFLWLIVPPLHAQTVRVAVAANAQFAMEELKAVFEKQTGITVETVINSSGKITTQIQQGAPFDVFLSADMHYPEVLFKEGFTTEAPKIYGYGSLVVWGLGNVKVTKDLSFLTQPSVRKIAVANPKLAPYGTAAQEALTYYHLSDKTRSKWVLGESISQVNQYILSQAVEVGFTSKSVVLDPSLKGKGNWAEVDSKTYTPIAQGVVLLKKKNTAPSRQAQSFYDFLFSKRAQAIFRAFGYRLTGSTKQK